MENNIQSKMSIIEFNMLFFAENPQKYDIKFKF